MYTCSAPTYPVEIQTLPSAANILHVSVETCKNAAPNEPIQLLAATTADRRINLIVPCEGFPLFSTKTHVHDSPVLHCISVGGSNLTTITTSMSGQVILYDHKTEQALGERRDHGKYVVKVAAWEVPGAVWVATAGWDAKIFLYLLRIEAQGSVESLDPPVSSLTLPTNPETIMFIRHPDAETPILIVTRRDSTLLSYYKLPSSDEVLNSSCMNGELYLLGGQNLAPHSNAWTPFSPSSIALCPTDPTLLAVATSALPQMKLIIVRLLIPPLSDAEPVRSMPATQAEQTRQDIAIRDREDAAILIQVDTSAPQTPYSTPQVCWRPDGSGVWVNGDDGLVRGLEVKTGKVMATLRDGHELGSKIRSLWAGFVDFNGGREEWVISGGFDKKLIVWRPNNDEALH
jgi:WD40 repeat protein